jgi:alpha-galactosidase
VQRLYYGFAATLLGRMCLSGDVVAMNETQTGILREAEAFYEQAAPVIRDGHSRVHQQIGTSWRYPTGWQAVVRASKTRALVTYHEFDGEKPPQREIPLPEGTWSIAAVLNPELQAVVTHGKLIIHSLPPFSGGCVVLERE